MPDRYLREGFLRSAAINDLGTDTQIFYVRLLLLVDDFGCFDGRGPVIVTQAYPTRYGDELPDVEAMLRELHQGTLIVRYSNAGKPFIALTQWRNGLRSRRRFPAPPLDVDLYDGTGREPRGPYNREVIWNNPPGFEQASILLDLDGRAVVPQPPEWRPISHCGPVPRKHKPYAPSPGDQANTVTQELGTIPENGDAGLGTKARGLLMVKDKVLSMVVSPPPSPVVVGATEPVDQALHPPTTPTTNGKIGLEAGAFTGVTDAQCERWQGMFASMSIPDQLDRAAAWLEVNQAERDAIAAQGDGFGPFLVRWLLREARGTVRAKGGLDS